VRKAWAFVIDYTTKLNEAGLDVGGRRVLEDGSGFCL
jgi:hypothetical protein